MEFVNQAEWSGECMEAITTGHITITRALNEAQEILEGAVAANSIKEYKKVIKVNREK